MSVAQLKNNLSRIGFYNDGTGRFWLDGKEPHATSLFGAGTSSNRATTSVANTKHMSFYFENSATSGDNRAIYNRLYLTGAGSGGESLRSFTTVENVAGGTAHGAHLSLSFGTTGSITGLGVAARATLHVPNQAQSGGTYSAGMSEIWFDGSTSDISGATAHAIHTFSQGGNATAYGKATNVLTFSNLSSTQFDDVGTATCTATLKCVINGLVRYLMFADSAAA